MQKLVFVLIAACLIAARGTAEELYDFACCPNEDCHVSAIDQVTYSQAGFHIQGLDEVIRFDDPRIRPSRDGRYHLCTRSRATPEMKRTQIENLSEQRTLKCLYVPAQS